MVASDGYSGIVYIHYPTDFMTEASHELADMKKKNVYPRIRVMVDDYALTRKSIRAAKE